MTYLDMVNDGLNYIENHIDEELSFSDMANRYFISKFHYYRIFRALTGYTIRDYVDKRRLAIGAQLLKTTKMTVLEIAIECGIHSHEVFTRKFKKEYGITPRDWRKTYPPLRLLSPVVLIERDFINKHNDIVVPYTLEYKENFTLWGKVCNNGYNDEQDPDTVGNFLYEFADICFEEHPEGNLILATLYLDASTGMIDYFVGFNHAIKDHQNYQSIDFKASTYAVFTYKGVFRKNIRVITNDIYKAIALSNLTIEASNVAFFELYDIKYLETGLFKIMVPIKDC